MTGYIININNDCDKCMECVEVCQTGVLTEAFINMVKNKMNSIEPSDDNTTLEKYVHNCTYCESCEDVCEQKAIWVTNPEWEELQ